MVNCVCVGVGCLFFKWKSVCCCSSRFCRITKSVLKQMPRVPSCHAAWRVYMSYVPTCFTYSRVWRTDVAFVPLLLTYLLFLYALHAFILLCVVIFYVLSSFYEPKVPSSFTCLAYLYLFKCFQFLTCLTCLHVLL